MKLECTEEVVQTIEADAMDLIETILLNVDGDIAYDLEDIHKRVTKQLEEIVCRYVQATYPNWG